MRRFAPVLASLLLLAAPAFGQNFGPLPPLTEQLEVNVVNVDVTVTDRDGKPVMDLTRDDFEIFEDGQRQPITNFAIFSGPAATRGTTAAAPATAGKSDNARKILLLVDNNFIDKASRDHALSKIETYLDQSFGGEWAVGIIGRNARILQPFTGDKALVRVALRDVRKLPTNFQQQEMDRSILSDRTRRELERSEFSNNFDFGQTVRFSSREQTYRALLTMQNTARAVVDTARAYGADTGKKFIILLSGGMEMNRTFTSFSKKGRPDRELEQIKLDVVKVIDAMVREANAADFTIHVINARPRGMQAPQHGPENRSSGIQMSSNRIYRGDWGNDPIDTSDVDSAPLSIALGTGGMYLPSTDVTESIARIDEQTSNFYSLGYTPSHTGDRRYHNIRVRAKRDGVRVTNRVGYYDLSRNDRLEQMLRARMTFDRALGSLPVQITVGKPRSGGRMAVVPVQAAMPLDRVTMLPRDNAYVGRVHVYLSVFDDAGRNVGFHHQTQEVNVSSEQMNDRSSAFRYTMNVHLQEGSAFTVVMTVRDELSNEIGSASGPVRL